MFYMNRYCCDIIPPCFYHMFRPNHASIAKNFFDNLYPDKNIHHVLMDTAGKLTVVYDDGTYRETTYVHLQKRQMELSFQHADCGYMIMEKGFHAIRN